MSNLNDYDFIVGFTLFTPKGFKTMYRHFDKLETAKMFASNVNIKNNCKIYVDLEYFEKIKTDLLIKLEMKKVLFVRKDELEKDYIPKSKVREIIQKYYNEYEKEKEYRYTLDVEDEQRILREIEKELFQKGDK